MFPGACTGVGGSDCATVAGGATWRNSKMSVIPIVVSCTASLPPAAAGYDAGGHIAGPSLAE